MQWCWRCSEGETRHALASEQVSRCLPTTSRLKDPGLVLRVVYFYNGTAEEGRKAAKKLYDAGKAPSRIGKTSTWLTRDATGPSSETTMEELPYVKLNGLAVRSSSLSSNITHWIDASVEQNEVNYHGGRKYAKGLTMRSQSTWLHWHGVPSKSTSDGRLSDSSDTGRDEGPGRGNGTSEQVVGELH